MLSEHLTLYVRSKLRFTEEAEIRKKALPCGPANYIRTFEVGVSTEV